jgi:lipoprotein-anchoring transpeptidase ErfK/SrfK
LTPIFFLLIVACNSDTKVKTNNHLDADKFAVKPAAEELQIDTTVVLAKDSIVDTCAQLRCDVWAKVSLEEQRMYLYVDGILQDTFKVTTGNRSHKTPPMDRRPAGPLYVKYTSRKYPGGNYMGLGNMPYVVFIQGGYAIHGTTKGNISLLGKRVSHGCIRLHPDNAKIYFELVKSRGVENCWVTIF